MKKILLSLAIALAIAVTPALAHDLPRAKTIEKFNKEFKGAIHVNWHEVGDFQMATFGYNQHHVVAYYSSDGEFVGSSRDLLYEELPHAVSRAIDQRFPDAVDLMIHEVYNAEGTNYWITLTAGNKSNHVKLNANGSFLQIEKVQAKAGSSRDLACIY